MIKFSYKKIDGDEIWTYHDGNYLFEITRYNNHFSLTATHIISDISEQFNLMNWVEVSNFIELNY